MYSEGVCANSKAERESYGSEKKKGTSPFSIALLHNLIYIDTGDECNAGLFDVNLFGGVYAVTYKSRLYTKKHLWSGFSAQVFRDRADNRLNPRDLYKGEPFCRCFLVQARLVHEPSRANQPVHKQKRPAAMRGVWSGKRDSNYFL